MTRRVGSVYVSVDRPVTFAPHTPVMWLVLVADISCMVVSRHDLVTPWGVTREEALSIACDRWVS